MRHNIGGCPYLLALDTSGAGLWATQLDAHPAALVTASPTLHTGFAYIGTSSLEEARAGALNCPCCKCALGGRASGVACVMAGGGGRAWGVRG